MYNNYYTEIYLENYTSFMPITKHLFSDADSDEETDSSMGNTNPIYTAFNDDGFVYIEVPDGEISSKFGKNREEFFIDHYHIFSIASVAIMANKSGYNIQNILRLNEPSGKFTIRAFLTKTK